MFAIKLPNGNVFEYERPITGLSIAERISKGLAKEALVAEVNGELWDLNREIDFDASIKIIKDNDPEGLEIIRHDAAHILAQAIKETFPDAQITIGPVIENGFYYDVFREQTISENDLLILEEKMKEIIQKNYSINREIWDRDKAIDYFKNIGEYYKAEIIESIPVGEKITIYRQGDFLDLCRGPHALSTGAVKYFKLMKLAGAYWRGDSKNEMLQRIYGTAWATKDDLNNYLHMLEEAKKRDHRKLGNELDLFHIQDEARGQVFWHEKGWIIYNIIKKYIADRLLEHDYQEVNTPIMASRDLWKKSGHWDKFRDNMFITDVDNGKSDQEVYAIKPMNCPCHIQIFNRNIRSYKDLPLKISEFGMCHRNEPSGSLYGLMRVRGFVQDDAHIFCMESQITEETKNFCDLLLNIYKDFGFTDVKVKFADRPEERAGTDDVWDKAEGALMEAIKSTGLSFTINKGEGAFYGPKLEFVLRDAIGRDWQCGTLQVDFVMPERLGACYVAKDGQKYHPVMLHRAILGTFERFIGILIEQYAGKFPLWLAPVQVSIVTIVNKVDDYALSLYKRLRALSVRVELDLSNEKISYKIRGHSTRKVPQIWIIGENELLNNEVSVRYLGSNKNKVFDADSAINDMLSHIKSKVF